ncbi:MAG: STAS domain-containing protein [Phycisphaeraceae bacterium]
MLPQEIELEQSGSVITVRIHEAEISHLHMQELVNECLERMRYHNARDVLLDMADVEFLASACLGPLVSMLQDLEHVCGRVALVNCRENVAFLFRVTRLDAVVGIYDDEKEALANL